MMLVHIFPLGIKAKVSSHDKGTTIITFTGIPKLPKTDYTLWILAGVFCEGHFRLPLNAYRISLTTECITLTEGTITSLHQQMNSTRYP